MLASDEENQIDGLKKSIAETELAMEKMKQTISQIDARLRHSNSQASVNSGAGDKSSADK